MEKDDRGLLRQYIEQNSQGAFASSRRDTCGLSTGRACGN